MIKKTHDIKDISLADQDCDRVEWALTEIADGEELVFCASNPLSTQDDVAASLMQHYHFPIIAMRIEGGSTYYQHIAKRWINGQSSPWMMVLIWSVNCIKTAMIYLQKL